MAPLWKWVVAREGGSRAAGRVLHASEAAELIAAEVLSALPIDEHADEGPYEEAGVSWGQKSEPDDPSPGALARAARWLPDL